MEGLAYLPVVDGAVSSPEGVALGILQGVQNNFILGVEIHSQHLVEFVHHFGGSGVFRSSFGVFASGPLDAGQFFIRSRGVHDEAHASTEVRLSQGGFFSTSGGGSYTEESKAENESLEDDEDEQIRQVERQYLRG